MDTIQRLRNIIKDYERKLEYLESEKEHSKREDLPFDYNRYAAHKTYFKYSIFQGKRELALEKLKQNK